MPWTPRRSETTMIAIGGTVGLAAAVSPRLLQRAFGIPAEEITGAGAMGWRLFAARNLWISCRAARGDQAALDSFAPLQALDQAVFWQAFATRSVPRSTAVLAALTSGAVVALDVHRRRADDAS